MVWERPFPCPRHYFEAILSGWRHQNRSAVIGWVTTKHILDGRKSGEAMEEKKILLLGGDRRTVWLARLLLKKGWTVYSGFLKDRDLPEEIKKWEPEEEMPEKLEAVMLPVPALGAGTRLRTSLWPEPVELAPLLDRLPPGTLVAGGKLKPLVEPMLAARNLVGEDLLDREELTVMNAAYTAQGAVEIALRETETSLLGARCTVTGYGRIARILARYLAALGARVTVAARRAEQLAWAQVEGYYTVEISRLAEKASQTDILFNTAPGLVAGYPVLSGLPRDVLVVELASPPGGIDLDTARELGLRVIPAGGLPGKCAPRAAGESIAHALENILKERRATHE